LYPLGLLASADMGSRPLQTNPEEERTVSELLRKWSAAHRLAMHASNRPRKEVPPRPKRIVRVETVWFGPASFGPLSVRIKPLWGRPRFAPEGKPARGRTVKRGKYRRIAQSDFAPTRWASR
jgi:hypothetical protein